MCSDERPVAVPGERVDIKSGIKSERLFVGKTYIGIDPGSRGFVCVLYGDGRRSYMGLYGHCLLDVSLFLRSVKEASPGGVVCCMEEIHAVHGSSAGATFSFGEVYGMLKGVLTALGIGYHLVPPKTWQKELWTSDDKVWKTGDGKRRVDQKSTSMRAALRLFPMVDFRRSERCVRWDDNKCDATLICEYGRRLNL